MFDGLEWTLAFTWPLVLLGMVIWVVRKARSAL
jgi:hypothetical protein